MKKPLAIILGIGVGVLILLAAPFFGAESVGLADLWEKGSAAHRIFFELRLPRLALAAIVGGSLAVLGGSYQILFHNPLAEPYLLGISSAVLLGSAVGEILFHLAPFSLGSASCGLAVALLVTVPIVFLGSNRFAQAASLVVDRLVLFGVGVNFVLSSLLFLLVSYHAQQMGGGSWRWLFGQIPWISGHEVIGIAAMALPFLVVLLLMSRHLDALSIGDSVARSLGYSPERARAFLLFWTSAFLAGLVCFTGAIGFVGLVIPHATRLLFRPPTTRLLLLLSFALGMVFLVGADVLSRSLLPPYEFPIGIITTLLGGPIFLYLLWRQQRP